MQSFSFFEPQPNHLSARIYFMCSKDGEGENKFNCTINKNLEHPKTINTVNDFHYLNLLINMELKRLFENGTEGRVFNLNIHLAGVWGAKETDLIFTSLNAYVQHLQTIGFDCRDMQKLVHLTQTLEFEKNASSKTKDGPMRFVKQ